MSEGVVPRDEHREQVAELIAEMCPVVIHNHDWAYILADALVAGGYCPQPDDRETAVLTATVRFLREYLTLLGTDPLHRAEEVAAVIRDVEALGDGGYCPTPLPEPDLRDTLIRCRAAHGVTKPGDEADGSTPLTESWRFCEAVEAEVARGLLVTPPPAPDLMEALIASFSPETETRP